MARYTLDITTADGYAPIRSGDKYGTLSRLRVALRKFAMGGYPVGTNSIDARSAAAQASGTITLASCAAGTVIEINKVRFRARATGTAVAANNEFVISGTDTADATALAAAINACTSAKISGVVVATSSGAVVTVKSKIAGRVGNALSIKSLGVLSTAVITLASVSADDTVTINGAALTAKTSAPSTDQWLVGVTDTADATALAALINSTATALIADHVEATSEAAVVTLWAKAATEVGNSVTIATSNGSRLAITGSLSRLGSGVITQGEGARASATVTITSGSGNYTVTINGVNASGTVAYNATDTQTGADIADAINKSTNALVANQIVATAASGVVTVTAIRGGVQGNAITLAATGTGAVASTARLIGGAAPTTVVCSADRLASGSETLVALTF